MILERGWTGGQENTFDSLVRKGLSFRVTAERSPTLAFFAALNDSLDDDERQRLLPLVDSVRETLSRPHAVATHVRIFSEWTQARYARLVLADLPSQCRDLARAEQCEPVDRASAEASVVARAFTLASHEVAVGNALAVSLSEAMMPFASNQLAVEAWRYWHAIWSVYLECGSTLAYCSVRATVIAEHAKSVHTELWELVSRLTATREP